MENLLIHWCPGLINTPRVIFSLELWAPWPLPPLAWLGIRGMSWVLFASHGTPLIMAIIQGSALKLGATEASGEKQQLMEIRLIEQVSKEFEWALEKGNEVSNAFLLPPLQILAASVNFCTFLFTFDPHF